MIKYDWKTKKNPIKLLKSYMKELKSENAPTETLSKAIDEIHDINVEVNKFTAEQDCFLNRLIKFFKKTSSEMIGSFLKFLLRQFKNLERIIIGKCLILCTKLKVVRLDFYRLAESSFENSM